MIYKNKDLAFIQRIRKQNRSSLKDLYYGRLEKLGVVGHYNYNQRKCYSNGKDQVNNNVNIYKTGIDKKVHIFTSNNNKEQLNQNSLLGGGIGGKTLKSYPSMLGDKLDGRLPLYNKINENDNVFYDGRNNSLRFFNFDKPKRPPNALEYYKSQVKKFEETNHSTNNIEYKVDTTSISELLNLIDIENYSNLDFSTPDFGSIVEISSPTSIVFGIVVSTNLNPPFFNEITIFTLDGHLIIANLNDITFILPGFFNEEKIKEVFNNKSSSTSKSKTEEDTNLPIIKYQLLYILNVFINDILSMQKTIASQLEAFYSVTSDLELSNATTLQNCFDYISQYFSSSYDFHIINNKLSKSLLLFAIHLSLISDPINYLYISKHFYNAGLPSLTTSSFISTNPSSLSLKSNKPLYCINCQNLRNEFNNVLRFKNSIFQEFIQLFEFKSGKGIKNYDYDNDTKKELNKLIYKNLRNQSILNFLKYYLINPDYRFTRVIKLIIDYMDDSQKIIKDNNNDYLIENKQDEWVNPVILYNRMVSLQMISPNEDIISSFLNSTPSVTREESANTTSSTHTEKNDTLLTNVPATIKEDPFVKFRYNWFQFPIYALPSHILAQHGFPANSELAISIERKNSRIWIVNIHVIEIGSIITPDNVQLNKYLKLVKTNSSKLLFEDVFLDTHSFSSGKSVNCITFSMEYRPTDEQPWNTPNYDVSLSTVSNVKFVTLDVLKDIIETGGYQGLFKNINSLNFDDKYDDDNNENESKNYKLTNEDKDNISCLYDILSNRYWKRLIDHANESSLPITEVKEIELNENKNEEKNEMRESSDEIADFPKDLKNIKVDLVQVKKTAVDRFLNECSLLANEICARFGIREEFPLYYHSQLLRTTALSVPSSTTKSLSSGSSITEVGKPILDTTATPDIKYPSLLEYHQYTSKRNSFGEVSPENYIKAQKFLSFEKCSTTYNQHFGLGLSWGYSGINSPLNNFEHVINQWQLLIKLRQKKIEEDLELEQQQQKEESSSLLNIEELNELKIKNKTVNNETPPWMILNSQELNDIYESYIGPKQQIILAEEYYKHRYGVLRWLKQNIEESNIDDGKKTTISEFICIITESAFIKSSEYASLARAFCLELGIEVSVISMSNKNRKVGESVKCIDVLKLDFLTGECVFISD